MKKLLFSGLLVLSTAFANAQITLIDENFDSYPDFAITGFGNWLTLDLDLLPTYTGGGAPVPWTNANAAQAFMIFNPTAAGVTNGEGGENSNFDPHSGTKYAAAWSSVPATSGGPGNNDWLISPVIQLGTTGNTLTFWVKSLADDYGLDKYKVGVYVGTGTPTSSANFTIISGANSLSAPITWSQVTHSLAAYAGQNVRIGIQCVSQDNYMLMVDDFKVTATTLGTSEVADSNSFSVAPNPATDFITVKTKGKVKKVFIYDMTGRIMNAKIEGNTIDVRSLQNGSYIIDIDTSQGKTSQKFIKR